MISAKIVAACTPGWKMQAECYDDDGTRQRFPVVAVVAVVVSDIGNVSLIAAGPDGDLTPVTRLNGFKTLVKETK